MANTTPKMSLRMWDQLSDPFSNDQLSDNWSKLDLHDHTPGRGIPIPTEGLADGAVTPTKAAATLDPTSAYTSWKVVRTVGGSVGASVLATRVLGESSPNDLAMTSPTALLSVTYFDPADYAASGRTVRLRIVGSVYTNGTAPGTTLGVNLYSVAGVSAGQITGSLGVTSITALTTAPALNSMTTFAGTEATAPVAGHYVMAILPTATTAASSLTVVRAQLQMRQV